MNVGTNASQKTSALLSNVEAHLGNFYEKYEARMRRKIPVMLLVPKK
jgi:hypothetical protein